MRSTIEEEASSNAARLKSGAKVSIARWKKLFMKSTYHPSLSHSAFLSCCKSFVSSIVIRFVYTDKDLLLNKQYRWCDSAIDQSLDDWS